MITTLLHSSFLFRNSVKCLVSASLFGLSLVSGLTLTSPALGAVATFDDLPEGFSGTTITSGGITFSNLIAGFRLSSEPPQFVVESTDQLEPLFSAPNYLTTDPGFTSGSDPDFGSFGSAQISTDNVVSNASLDIFSSSVFDQSDTLIVLEAFLNGNPVASASTSLSEFTVFGPDNELLSTNLSLSGVEFDTLQLYTPIAFADGVVNIGIDNVVLGEAASVPEPSSTLALAVLGVGCIVSRLKQAGRPKQ